MKRLIAMLIFLSLLGACKDAGRDEVKKKYKTLTVALTDCTLRSDYTATLRGRQHVEIRP